MGSFRRSTTCRNRATLPVDDVMRGLFDMTLSAAGWTWYAALCADALNTHMALACATFLKFSKPRLPARGHDAARTVHALRFAVRSHSSMQGEAAQHSRLI